MNLATLQYKDSYDCKVYTFSKEDTYRLKDLFCVEAGWGDAMEYKHNSLYYSLQLDGIIYSFDLKDCYCSMRCRQKDAVWGWEIYNGDTKVVEEIFEILKSV